MSATCIAVEIGGTKLQAALGTVDGKILSVERTAAPSEDGAAAILSWFDASVPRLLRTAAAQGHAPSRIGIGFGGPVDSAAGRVFKSHQVAGWDDFPLRAHFEERFGLPASLHNDSSAAGWGEYCLGAGRGTRNFCYMNIGSGIGGALVIDGKLCDGQGFGAGEIGHTWVPDWSAAAPGAAIKLEDLCSGWSIEARLRSTEAPPPGSRLHALSCGDPAKLRCALLGEAAAAGDAFARAQIARLAESLGVALANVVALFHPERIAVGGGVGLIGEPLLGPVRTAVAARAFSPFQGRYEIVPCTLGEEVVLAGALLLCRQQRSPE